MALVTVGTGTNGILEFSKFHGVPTGDGLETTVALFLGEYTFKAEMYYGYSWYLYKGDQLIGSRVEFLNASVAHWRITVDGTNIRCQGWDNLERIGSPLVDFTAFEETWFLPQGDFMVDDYYMQNISFTEIPMTLDQEWELNRTAVVQKQWLTRITVGPFDPMGFDETALVFDNDKIVEVVVNEKIDPLGLTVPVSSCGFTLENYDFKFSADNPNNELNHLRRGSQVKVEYSFDGFSGGFDFVPEQVFIIDSVTSDDIAGNVNVACLSVSSLLDRPFTDRTWKGVPRSANAIICDIFSQSGFPSTPREGYQVYPSGNSLNKQVYPADITTEKSYFSYSEPVGSVYYKWLTDIGLDITVDVPLENMSLRDALARVLTRMGCYLKEVSGNVLLKEHPVRGHWNYKVGTSQVFSAAQTELILPLYTFGSDVESYRNYRLTPDLMFSFPKTELPIKLGTVTSKLYSVDSLDPKTEVEVIIDKVPLRIPPPLTLDDIISDPEYLFTVNHSGVHPQYTRVVLDKGYIGVGGGGSGLYDNGYEHPFPNPYSTTFLVTGVAQGEWFNATIVGKKLKISANTWESRFNGDRNAEFDNPVMSDVGDLEIYLHDAAWNLDRSTYTVNTRNDPNLGLGDNIQLDSRYIKGEIVTLTEAKRTFNGGFRAEYTFN